MLLAMKQIMVCNTLYISLTGTRKISLGNIPKPSFQKIPNYSEKKIVYGLGIAKVYRVGCLFVNPLCTHLQQRLFQFASCLEDSFK